MSGQHTQGRLVAEDGQLYAEEIGNVYGYQVAIAGHSGTDFPLDVVEANARRLAACRNACEGLTTEEVEQHHVRHELDAWREKLANATAERDQLRIELVAARALLAEAVPHIDPKAVNIELARTGTMEDAYINTRVARFLRGPKDDSVRPLRERAL